MSIASLSIEVGDRVRMKAADCWDGVTGTITYISEDGLASFVVDRDARYSKHATIGGDLVYDHHPGYCSGLGAGSYALDRFEVYVPEVIVRCPECGESFVLDHYLCPECR